METEQQTEKAESALSSQNNKIAEDKIQGGENVSLPAVSSNQQSSASQTIAALVNLLPFSSAKNYKIGIPILAVFVILLFLGIFYLVKRMIRRKNK